MKRRNFLQTVLLATACSSGKGILPLDPNEKDEKEVETIQESIISNLQDNPYQILAPSGNSILFCKNKNLSIVNAIPDSISRELILSPDSTATITNPNWAIDDIVLFQLDYSKDISKIYAKSAFFGIATQLDLGLGEGKYEYPTRSPDGKVLAFTFNGDLHFIPFPIQGKPTKVSLDEKVKTWYNWIGMYSWHNGKLAFALSTPTYPTNIYVLDNIVLGNVTKITNTGDNFNPSWSPDGTVIAFDSNRDTIGGEHYIYLSNLETKELTRVTKPAVKIPDSKLTMNSGENPKFHPYKKDLTFTRTAALGYGISLIINAY